MRNKLLVTVLAICAAVCTVITDYIYTSGVYENRANEAALYASLNADPHTEYRGFTVEELGEGYEKPSGLFGKTVLNVPVINQFPEMPVGCEITSATALLQYLGFDIDKITMANNYVICDDNFTYDGKGDSHGPDPYKVFAGDPFRWGYGCYAPVIEEALNRYFEASGSDYKALALYNINSADIEKLIDEGVPVIVWATQDMKQFNYRNPSEWYINGTGEKLQWFGNSHTLVLCGYDSLCYHFMDSNDKNEITLYLKEQFLRRFDEAGKQCVIVKLN